MPAGLWPSSLRAWGTTVHGAMCAVVISRMNRRHALALGGVLAASIIAWAWLQRVPATPVQSSASPLRPADLSGGSEVNPRATRTEPPTAAAIAADAERSAQLWMARAEGVTRAKRARLFGEDVAHLLALPADDAWSALIVRAHDGDRAAAAAAMLLAVECRQWSQSLASNASTRVLDDATSAPLPPEWARFVRATARQQEARRNARLHPCDGVGGIVEFALLMLDRMLATDDPQVRLMEAADIDNDDEAIEALRELALRDDDRAAHVELGRRLLKSHDAQAQAEGRVMLEQLAIGDPDVVDFLAGCFLDGCGAFQGDRTVADAWVERAAGMGSWWALGVRIVALEAAGDASGAWAWSLYRRDLASLGCFSLYQPDWTHLAQAAHGASAIEATLQPAQRASGQAIAAHIAQRWQALAAERLACG